MPEKAASHHVLLLWAKKSCENVMKQIIKKIVKVKPGRAFSKMEKTCCCFLLDTQDIIIERKT